MDIEKRIEQIERAIEKLEKHIEVSNLSVYKCFENDWIYYYSISGSFRGNYFDTYISMHSLEMKEEFKNAHTTIEKREVRKLIKNLLKE